MAFSWGPPEDGTTPDGVVCLPKTLTAAQLVVALEEVVEGRHPGLHASTSAGYWSTAPAAPKPPAPDPGVRVLTAREHDVLSLITAGLPNRDIAARLGLSLNSVKTYIRTAYRKIGAERRTQAMLWVWSMASPPPRALPPAPERAPVAKRVHRTLTASPLMKPGSR